MSTLTGTILSHPWISTAVVVLVLYVVYMMNAPASPKPAPVQAPPSTLTTVVQSATPAPTQAPVSQAPTVDTTPYEGKIVRCDSTGNMWFIEGGLKRSIDPSVANMGANFSNVSCDIISGIPDGAAAEIGMSMGNNGSVTCPQFISGLWTGASDLAGKALGGIPLTAGPNADGSCPMIYTNDPQYAFARKIAGNNGTVSCPQFCSGSWGRDQLRALWPGATGAQLAIGAPDQAGADGSCWCSPSKDPANQWAL